MAEVTETEVTRRQMLKVSAAAAAAAGYAISVETVLAQEDRHAGHHRRRPGR
jgi:hypothetical protein